MSEVTLSLWDTAGQERFHALAPIYYRDANGAVLVYDITNAKSFQKIQHWYRELTKIVGSSVTVIIVGNKIDLQSIKQVSDDDAKEFAKNINANIMFTSAKTGQFVHQLFKQLTEDMIKNPNNYGNKFKVILLGEGRVGKTSILNRYNNNTFSESQSSTFGASYIEKRVAVSGQLNMSQPRSSRLRPSTHSRAPRCKISVIDESSIISVSNTIGLSIGGSKDVNNFRQCIKQNIMPSVSAITYNGLFYDYYFDTMSHRQYDNQEKKENDHDSFGDEGDDGSMLFYPSYCCAKTTALHIECDKKYVEDQDVDLDEYYITVGLNSNIQQDQFKRKHLNLVILLDKSGSMNSKLDNAFDPFSTGKNKMEVANKAVISLLKHLTDNDRIALVEFDSTANIKQKLQSVENVKMNELICTINNITASGGTNFEGGFQTAVHLFEFLSKNDKYENRIVMITDACPNEGSCNGSSLLSMVSQYSENCVFKCGRIYTSFIGVGLDFNSSLIEQISQTRGCNYFAVKSTEDFMKTMDDEFDYMVTPLVFNVCLKLICEGNTYKIDKVFGSNPSFQNGELTKIHTLFAAKKSTTTGESKGGVQLIKLQKLNDEHNKTMNAKVEVTFEDRNGLKYKNTQTILFKDDVEQKMKFNDMIEDDDVEQHDNCFYDNTGIRKAILLSKYAELIIDWIQNEKQNAGSKLIVSPKYNKVFGSFLVHFEEEMKKCNDKSLNQEVDILNKLSSSDAKEIIKNESYYSYISGVVDGFKSTISSWF